MHTTVSTLESLASLEARPAAPSAAARAYWALRVGAALCFIGHGAFGIITKQAWLPFFALWLRHGFGSAVALVALGAASLVVAVPIAMAAGSSRAWGAWLYGPLAVLAAAATVAWSFGGPQ